MTDVKERTYEEQERKRLDSVWWGGAFIWVGLVLGAEWLDILPTIADTDNWWPWIFIGLGPWALAMNVYRSMTDLPNPSTWDWVWTAIFVMIAIGAFVDFSGAVAGAVALVVIGAVIMINALRRQ